MKLKAIAMQKTDLMFIAFCSLSYVRAAMQESLV